MRLVAWPLVVSKTKMGANNEEDKKYLVKGLLWIAIYIVMNYDDMAHVLWLGNLGK